MWMIFWVLLVVFSNELHAESLGVIGPSYDIGEQDILSVIEEKFGSNAEEFEKLNEDLLDGAKSYVERPRGVHLKRAREYRAVEISVEYTLDRDIYDSEGKLLHESGKTVNPLESYPLSKTLCFFDADDPDQMDWVAQHCMDNPANKLIAVNGNLAYSSKFFGRHVYFDQRGYLIERFGIGGLPAVIRQSGKHLFMEEFPID